MEGNCPIVHLRLLYSSYWEICELGCLEEKESEHESKLSKCLVPWKVFKNTFEITVNSPLLDIPYLEFEL
ncbi:AAEL017482-PA [Aedes aegypti]|uniref:AAEL017482-PA n=1 Tax=Aedes aegypti TaxID=7159 RepID=J9HYW9_AEDAE|nr:AAEL017482-PA [Aedes aegypti]